MFQAQFILWSTMTRAHPVSSPPRTTVLSVWMSSSGLCSGYSLCGVSSPSLTNPHEIHLNCQPHLRKLPLSSSSKHHQLSNNLTLSTPEGQKSFLHLLYLSIHPIFSLIIHSSIHPPTHPAICLPVIDLFIYSSIHLPIHPTIHLSIFNLSIHLSTYHPSTHLYPSIQSLLSTQPSTHLSIHPTVCVSVYLSIHWKFHSVSLSTALKPRQIRYHQLASANCAMFRHSSTLPFVWP